MSAAVALDGTRGEAPDPRAVSLRRMGEADLPLMRRWLAEPRVAEWWYDEGTSEEEVRNEYLPLIEGRDPTRPFVILHGGTPIGYAQIYRVSDDEEYAPLVGLEDAVGIDLLIGEPEYLHRGLGPRVLRLLLADEVFSDPEVAVCVIGPEKGNAAAIRAYEKAGFRYFKTIVVPGERAPEHLMLLTREEFENPREGRV